jgi:hypothetical protein
LHIAKYDDSTSIGKFYSIELDTWVETEFKITGDKRLGLGRELAGEETIIMVRVEQNGEPFKVHDDEGREYLQFNRRNWIELRKMKGKDRYKPMFVSENGAIWVGETFKGCQFRVFTKLEGKG